VAVLLLLPSLLYACTSKPGRDPEDGGTKQDGKTADQTIKPDVVDRGVSPDQGKNPDLDAGVTPDKAQPDGPGTDGPVPDQPKTDLGIDTTASSDNNLAPNKDFPDTTIIGHYRSWLLEIVVVSSGDAI